MIDIDKVYHQAHGTPIILISSCRNAKVTGDGKYNGGVKVYNNWVKLLRNHDYQAFIVTWDGKYTNWLIEHQPHISIQDVKKLQKLGANLRFVTGWADSPAFLDLADRVYFFDCEIAHTIHSHIEMMRHLMNTNLEKIATNSRTQQAWYMATFKRKPMLIQNWADPTYWRPGEGRVSNLVGHVYECGEDKQNQLFLEELRRSCPDHTFIEIRGDEQDVLSALQKCDLYVGLNMGKDALWGEGCPRTQLEAMSVGAVTIAFDVNGNRENIIPGYTSYLVPRGEIYSMINKIKFLQKYPDIKEYVRRTMLNYIQTVFTAEHQWPVIKDFLDI